MNLKEIEKVVGSIQSHLFRNSNAFSVGMLKSHFKGAGLQFKEHQIYNPGDDVRFIDWKLSAKTNTIFVKTFEEERNVEIHILLDLSESMLVGYKGISKLQASLELTCLIYLLAKKSKDKVSVIIATDELKILPMASGQEGVILLISQLQKMKVLSANGKPNLDYEFPLRKSDKKIMALLKNLIARGKEVVMLSDLSKINEIETLNNLLYRHNMHCFKIKSPIDDTEKLPFSLFGKKGGKKITARINSKNNAEQSIKGRIKEIRVDERYLENFVRGML